MTYVIQDPNNPSSVLIEQGLLINVHHAAVCKGRACVIHSPTNHHMRDWKLHWRTDRKIFERICEHSCGHPDPDQEDYWRETDQEWQLVHGCCGCCSTPEDLWTN